MMKQIQTKFREKGYYKIPDQTGFRHTEETKRKIGESSKRNWESKEYRKKYNKNREYLKTNKEYKKKLSDGLKERWANPEFKKKMSAMFQDIPVSKWKGLSDYTFDSKKETKKFKNLIRKRDNQICMLCGIHREKLPFALDVHHINYDETLHLPENCISLCRSCHAKTHMNRKHWIKLFQSILTEKYDYKYLNDGKINIEVILDER